ncbi:hypothetical protein NMG60_11021883 [Bertholletia excelsa]
MERLADDQMESSLALSDQDCPQSQKEAEAEKAATDDCPSGYQAVKTMPDESNSDGVDVSKGRPMSPGTLALMCDEQDTLFMAAGSTEGLMGHSCNSSSQLPHRQGLTEVYAEQERIVLTKFRDCLNRLITLGAVKETKCSSLARTEPEGLRDALSNNSSNARTETRHQQEPFSNGVAKSAIPVPPTPMTSQLIAAATTALNKDLISKISSSAKMGLK